jgi:hypothetical protein
MTRLYKGGEESPFLHPIDARSWRALGWTDEPQTQSESGDVAGPMPEPETEPNGIDRAAELELMTWRQIKSIAELLGLYKEEGQEWVDLIPAIIEAELAPI